MKDKEKIEEQLKNELTELRQQIRELQKSIIEHQQIEESLRESEEKYRIAVEMNADAIFAETIEGRILGCNAAGAKMFDYTKEEIIGLTIADLVPEEFSKKLPKIITKKETTNGIFLPRISKKKDGTIFPTEIATNIVNIRGKPRLIVYIRDISEHKEAEKKLKKAREMFASLFNSSPEALVYLDEDSSIVNINPRFTKLFGYTLGEVKGKNINEGFIHPPSKIEEAKKLDKIILSKGYFNYESVRKKKDGTLFPVFMSGSNIIVDGQLKGSLIFYADITERKKMEEKLEKLAHFDTLTGCCNRGYGIGLLKEQIKLAQRKKYPLSLAYIDIDRFKYINDVFGHKEGDMILKEVVQLFKSTIREIDIISRMGGDEFLLIFPDSSSKDVSLIRERLDKNLEKLNRSLNRPYKISFSLGLSVYDPFNPQPVEKLIHLADQAMYKDKSKKNK